MRIAGISDLTFSSIRFDDGCASSCKAKINNDWKKWDASESEYTADGASVATGYTTSDTHIFFPAAGDGIGTVLYNKVSEGYYWSSTANVNDTNMAKCLHFVAQYIKPKDSANRYCGFSIRPVSE